MTKEQKVTETRAKKVWSGLKAKFVRMAYGICGITCKVADVDAGQEDQIGYTSSKKVICLNFFHPLATKLGLAERTTLIMGVFAHELLHQVYTDFRSFERKIMSYKEVERQIYSTTVNLLEDAAIENFAPQVMGGDLLKSLRYTIAHIYHESKKIEDSDTPFGQFVSALIQFGDMGLLKGKFTFPEAKSTFAKVAPIFAKGVEEPNCKKRLELASDIMELSRPLWEEEVKTAEQMQKLMEELNKMGKSQMRGAGRGQDANSDGSGSSKASKRRKITIKKVSKEELEEMKKNGEVSDGGNGGELPDGDFTAVMCDDDNKEGSEGGGNGINVSSDGKGSKGDNKDDGKDNGGNTIDADVEVIDETKPKDGKEKSSDKGDENSENGDANDANNSEDANNAENSENGKDGKDGKDDEKGKDANKNDMQKPSRSDSKDNPFVCEPHNDAERVENQPTPDGFEESNEDNGIGEISEEEYSISEEDIKRIEASIAEAEADYAKTEAEESRTVKIDDFPVTSPKLGKKSCLNYRVSCDNPDALEVAYSKVLGELGGGIKNLTTQLRRIFENDTEKIEYRTSGKINLKRANSGRVSARVFDRKVDPIGKSDFCVELLVDESGSMSGGGKDKAARYCCIALAEVFNNLHIPCYIIGFTADTRGYDIVHNHYITWKNTKNERLKLLNITARANNCDGYSIRYATEVLKKAKSANKLLIVLSDGQPAASGYYDGIADTKNAIRDAKKNSNVLGVAIGNSDTEDIYYMYENDFLHISNVQDLFTGLGQKLHKMMKVWGN